MKLIKENGLMAMLKKRQVNTNIKHEIIN